LTAGETSLDVGCQATDAGRAVADGVDVVELLGAGAGAAVLELGEVDPLAVGVGTDEVQPASTPADSPASPPRNTRRSITLTSPTWSISRHQLTT